MNPSQQAAIEFALSAKDFAIIHGPPGTGWIEVITGVMFSGKSEELIRRVRRALIARKRVQLFKSALDDRYAGVSRISSHDGATVDAVPIRSGMELAQLAHDLAAYDITVNCVAPGLIDTVRGTPSSPELSQPPGAWTCRPGRWSGSSP